MSELKNSKFCRLTVTEKDSNKTHDGHTKWLCICECGNTASVRQTYLLSGHTKSCGCLANSNRMTSKHGLSYGKIYSVYGSMKGRCYNQNHKFYKYYGGKGIKVCDLWLNDFKKFYEWALSAGYKEGLSIDRICGDGDYSPENCRWATDIEQQNNTSYNVKLLVNGELMSLAELSRFSGIKQRTLWGRLNRGWKIEDLLKPVDFKSWTMKVREKNRTRARATKV